MSKANPFLKRYRKLAQEEFNEKIRQAAEAAPELERKAKTAMAKILARHGGVFDMFVERFDNGKNLERDFAEYAAFLEAKSELLFSEFEAQRKDGKEVTKSETVASQTVTNESVAKAESDKAITEMPVKNESAMQQVTNNNRASKMMSVFTGQDAAKPDWMVAFDK